MACLKGMQYHECVGADVGGRLIQDVDVLAFQVFGKTEVGAETQRDSRALNLMEI